MIFRQPPDSGSSLYTYLISEPATRQTLGAVPSHRTRRHLALVPPTA